MYVYIYRYIHNMYIYMFLLRVVLPPLAWDVGSFCAKVHKTFLSAFGARLLGWIEILKVLMEEILHQLVGSLSHYLQGFITSQVVQDFFHQRYDPNIVCACVSGIDIFLCLLFVTATFSFSILEWIRTLGKGHQLAVRGQQQWQSAEASNW